MQRENRKGINQEDVQAGGKCCSIYSFGLILIINNRE